MKTFIEMTAVQRLQARALFGNAGQYDGYSYGLAEDGEVLHHRQRVHGGWRHAREVLEPIVDRLGRKRHSIGRGLKTGLAICLITSMVVANGTMAANPASETASKKVARPIGAIANDEIEKAKERSIREVFQASQRAARQAMRNACRKIPGVRC